MKSGTKLLFLTISFCLIAPCQTAPAFNVASIRVGDGRIVETIPELSPGRIVWTPDLFYLIAYACNSDIQWVSGAIPKGTYRIEATFDPAATNAQVREMLRSLLVTRFGMKAHRGTAEAPGFALAVAKGGPKLHESKPDDTSPGGGRVVGMMHEKGIVELVGHQVSMEQLAIGLARIAKAQVWDKTGITGNYDFDFRISLDDPSLADASSSYPRLADALRQEYGLQLERQTGPTETIVVDHIEQIPTEN